MEIERKYLVPLLPDLSMSFKSVTITQAYICIDPEIRIRNMGNQYFLTQKSSGMLIREEIEREVTFDTFYENYKNKIGNVINKTRYYFSLENGFIAELDVYGDSLNGLLTVEVEFPDERSAHLFNRPNWFGMEITNDGRYKNKSLAMFGLPLNT